MSLAIAPGRPLRGLLGWRLPRVERVRVNAWYVGRTVTVPRWTKPAVRICAALGAIVGFAFTPLARVTLENDGADPISDVVLEARCLHRDLGTIPPGSSATIWFSPCAETSVSLSFRANGTVYERDVDVYVPRRPPSGRIIRVLEGASVRGDLDGEWLFMLVPRGIRRWVDGAVRGNG